MIVFGGGPRDHVVQFYETDDDLAARVTAYLLGAMQDHGAGIVVATPAHRAAIEARLEQAGVHPAAAREHGTYVALDAEAVMNHFMINGFADPAGFWRVISPVVKKASGKRRKVRVFGEMVALLWAAGLPGAAVDLEALWNELASQYSFSVFCAYPAGLLSEPGHANELAEVIGAHSATIAGGGRGEDALSLLSAGEIRSGLAAG